jgi:hypothetical protein
MRIPNEIKSLLSSVADISLGCNEINFVKPDGFFREQIGFRAAPDGTSFVSEKEGDWKEGWIVLLQLIS